MLTLHGIGRPERELDPGESRVWLSEAVFERLLDALAAREDVALTFDDGNRSDLRVAAPALGRRGLRAVFFVSVGRLGQPGFLDAPALHDLMAAGMEIGLHGFEHRSWRGLPTDALKLETGDARRRLEDALGVAVSRAACPFGAYDRRVLGVLRRCGFARVYTSDGGPTRAHAWLVPRTTVLSDTPPETLLERLADRPWSVEALLRRLRVTAKRLRPAPAVRAL